MYGLAGVEAHRRPGLGLLDGLGKVTIGEGCGCTDNEILEGLDFNGGVEEILGHLGLLLLLLMRWCCCC